MPLVGSVAEVENGRGKRARLRSAEVASKSVAVVPCFAARKSKYVLLSGQDIPNSLTLSQPCHQPAELARQANAVCIPANIEPDIGDRKHPCGLFPSDRG